MIQQAIEVLFGSKRDQDLKQLLPLVRTINELEPWAMGLEREAFSAKTAEFKGRLGKGEPLDSILPEAFAMVREAARRTLGERLYDVQLMGGIVLHQGRIMEMKTGEGKTISSVTAAYLNALTGNGVHVITVNDYLASRDAAWMEPVYSYLGVSVGYIANQMDNEARRLAYGKDITYGTNNEFGFDYLRDNMRYDASRKVQRGHHYAIIDEIDSILIDEARTPLIISGQAEDDVRKYVEVNRVVKSLEECAKDPETNDYPEYPEGDYKVDEKGKRITFTDEGLNHLEELLQRQKLIGGSLFDEENFEYIHYATQALKAQRLFHKDQQYVVKEGAVQIVDEFTGRILYGRRYSEGLHQAIEAKEGIRVAQRNRTLATITFQNFFRMYEKVSGMTGTAETEEKEFGNIYGLDVAVIPTNLPVVRADEDDLIYVSEDDKYEAICNEIEAVHNDGQPMLVGTVSIERSEKISNLLKKRGIPHEVLNAKNHAREALIIAEAGAKGAVTIATNMAGRGTDIKLGGNPEFRARRAVGTDATEEEYWKEYRAEHRRWLNQYEEVRKLGGLYVLGTERHESRRIDNQLRGRSGRQGDPGRSRFFLSLDDDLMRLFGRSSGSLRGLMQRGLPPGEPLNHPIINRSIERAQSKVEERNFDIRKHLLEYDDVLNEQRKLIYSQRDEILKDDKLTERVLNTAADILQDKLEPYVRTRGQDKQLLAEFIEDLRTTLFYTTERTLDELFELSIDDLEKTLLEDLRRDIREKEEAAGSAELNRAIRHEYLRNIDARWQDHLENLEALREAVYLRSYAQKNPLLEYKLEGFQIFDELIYNIRSTIARKLFAVKAESFRDRSRVVGPASSAQASHGSMQMIGGGAGGDRGSGGGAATATAPRRTTVQRSVPKVGRNDPCPCGSGKKYKHCHGR
ncbi:MAG: preprotein translocase subunit SecA [Spirochaetaceae bacterium]